MCTHLNLSITFNAFLILSALSFLLRILLNKSSAHLLHSFRVVSRGPVKLPPVALSSSSSMHVLTCKNVVFLSTVKLQLTYFVKQETFMIIIIILHSSTKKQIHQVNDMPVTLHEYGTVNDMFAAYFT